MNVTFVERLDFWTCFFLESSQHIVFTKDDNIVTSTRKEGNDDNTRSIQVENIAVSDDNTNFIRQAHKYYCKAHGDSITGSEYGGRVLCIFICTFIFLVGLFGVVANVLNVILLRKSFVGKGPTTFKESLILLSLIELVLCAATIGFAFFTILILENFSRGQATMELFRASNLIFTLTRTMSVYTTILITMERFLVVAFPIKSKVWLYDQAWKSRVALGAVLLFSLLLNLPWIFKSSIVENEYETMDVQSNIAVVDDEDKNVTLILSNELMDFPYLIKRNAFAKRFNRGLQETLLALDFVFPFPILLLFNGFLYYSIYNWNKARAALSGRQKSDINAAKMFSVVVLILLSCHSVSCAVFFTSRVQHVIFRELMLLQSLAATFGSSANFLVYYWFKAGFQKEFWGGMRTVFGDGFSWINRHYEKFRKDSAVTSHHSQNA